MFVKQPFVFFSFIKVWCFDSLYTHPLCSLLVSVKLRLSTLWHLLCVDCILFRTIKKCIILSIFSCLVQISAICDEMHYGNNLVTALKGKRCDMSRLVNDSSKQYCRYLTLIAVLKVSLMNTDISILKFRRFAIIIAI